MLIDENGTFITQRIHSNMALFKLSLTDRHFTIKFKDDFIDLPVDAPVLSTPIKATIWDDTVDVYEVQGNYSEWFSHHLGMKCTLVYFTEESRRPVDEKYKIADDQVSLADGYPFLLIGQSSLDDLNSRLESPVPMNRFRPNFVVTGGKPFEEDTWRNFRIGKNRFVGVKPCGRCTLITVDQETANKGSEPLTTLSAFRKTNNKINFGQNLIAIDYYEIQDGDEIELE
jgi:uncharacterized protein YcbX